MATTEHLKQAHAVMRHKLNLLEGLLTTSPHASAIKDLCLSLGRLLDEHVRREEAAMAPYAHRLDARLRTRALGDHADERALLRDINELFVSGQHASTSAIAPRLLGLIDHLRDHMALEEHEVFPTIDDAEQQLRARMAACVEDLASANAGAA